MEAIQNILNSLSPTSLEEMDSVKLMNRTDTKFIFNKDKLSRILESSKKHYKVLEIDNKRLLNYKTVYFDTDNFFMYTAHQNGKLNRYKIRYREYIDSAITFLEVKFKSNKGRTVKKRIQRKEITAYFSKKAQKFIEKNTPFQANDLHANIWNNFSRITLVHKEDKERITIDLNLSYKSSDKNIDLPFLVISEVKQEKYTQSSDFIKLLRNEKILETSMSKYCIGNALLNKNIKYNRFKEKLLTLKKLSYDSNCFEFTIGN